MSKKILRGILLVGIIVVCAMLYSKTFKAKKSLEVILWDNMYNENNIELFYENTDSLNNSLVTRNLEGTYRVSEIASGETEIEKALKVTEILNTIVEYDDVSDSSAVNGYDILKEKGTSKKVSGRDMAIIERDLLQSVGLISRVGEFRKEDAESESTPSYYVVEYWSHESSKWVMIDFRKGGYFEKDGIKLSALEVMESNLKDLNYMGQEVEKSYVKKMKKFMSSYTIAIDNTLSMKKSNTYITYLQGEEIISLKKGANYVSPTIYTNAKEMLNYAPDFKSEGLDGKSYLLIMKKPSNAKEENPIFIASAFRDGCVLKDSHIKINGEDFVDIDMYKEFELVKGSNSIELIDENNTVISKIVIQKN